MRCNSNIHVLCFCLQVIDIVEIQHIQQLGMLRELNLLRNPIQELPYYRLAILFHIPRLCLLDRHKVEVEEKVSALFF